MMLMPKLPLRIAAAGFEISVRATVPAGLVSTRSIGYPTDTQAGDLIILICGASANINAAPLDSANWNHIASTANLVSPATRVYWQIASASPPSNITISTGGTNTSGLAGIMLRIPRAQFDASGDFSTANPPSPTGPSASGGLAIAFYRSTTGTATWTVPSGMDLLHTNTAFNCSIFTELVGAGAVGTRASTPSAGTPVGIIFTIKKAP